MPSTYKPIDPDRGLARDNRGGMIWETQDIPVETQFGPYLDRQLVGQPNGGILMRQGPGGVAVFMYNDDPGVFLNERGAPVSEQFAAAAGFDVQSLGREKRKRLAMTAAQRAIEGEFSAEGQNANTIAERGDYRLVEVASGFFQVCFIEQDGKGSPLSANMPKKAAEKLFDELAGPA